MNGSRQHRTAHFATCLFGLILCLGIFCSTKAIAGILIENGLSHHLQVTAGSNYKGTVELRNTSDNTETIKLYLTDYTFSSDGSTDYPTPGTLARSNAAWITYNPNYLVLGPKEKATVQFEINVPAGDTRFGTYWSVLMVESIVPPDTTPTKAMKVTTNIRYGVQMITTFGASGKTELQFASTQLVREKAKRFFTATLKNTGDRFVETLLTLQLVDKDGKIRDFKGEMKKRFFPSTSAILDVDISEVPPGTFSAVVVADCGDDNLFGLQLPLEIKNE